MKPLILIIILFIGASIFISCETPGCTDDNALNYNFEANHNDGSCYYSTITFYAKYGFFNGIPINKIDVSVNGDFIESLSAVYPNGPGNCNANGTGKYQCQSGDPVDWNTIVYLANGATIFGSGNISPSSISSCIKVNVTR